MKRFFIALIACVFFVWAAIKVYPAITQFSGGSSGRALLILIAGATVALFLANFLLIKIAGWLFTKEKKHKNLGNKKAAKNDFQEMWQYVCRHKAMLILIGAIFFFLYAYQNNPALFSGLIQMLTFVIQMLFYVAFGIIQFVAIFWFMSQTKKTKIEPGDRKEVTLKDYWGQPRLVEVSQQWVSLLQGRDDFKEMGGSLISGVLLFGPPGTGKTFLAKAIAGASGIAFLGMEGSGFRGMFWGVDTMRVIELFGQARKLARKHGACILFIDEIDALGNRGGPGGGAAGGGMFGGMTGGALTRVLYEMDGISETSRIERIQERFAELLGFPAPKRNWALLVMGATNRVDAIDSALMRPGRFDTKIQVDPPDKSGRREIIKGYLAKIKSDETIDVEALVESTPQYTPVQIMSAIKKDAPRIAVFRGAKAVGHNDIDQALEEQRFGLAQPIEEWEPRQRESIAYHEGGHAVIAHYLHPEHRLNRLTIVRHSQALGYLEQLPLHEIYAMPLEHIVRDIHISYAGHVAAKIHFGEYWTGGLGDFQNIHNRLLALAAHSYFGFPVPLDSAILPQLLKDKKIQKWLEEQEKKVEQLLSEHWGEVENLSKALLLRDRLTNNEILPHLKKNSAGKGGA